MYISVDCQWTTWSSCSTSCGPGKEIRGKKWKAFNGGNDCKGSSQQDCNLKPCPIDCEWSQWGTCSTTCGSGKQTRSKQVTAKFGGKDCIGSYQQNCNTQNCPSEYFVFVP